MRFGHATDTNDRKAALERYGSDALRLEPYAADDLDYVVGELRDDPVWRFMGYDRIFPYS